MVNIKPATTFEEQVKIMNSRGLLIEDEEFAISILSRMNYYTITGYIHAFKKDHDNYVDGLSFYNIYKIIEFDRRFRNLILYGIETIEHLLKTKIAYNIAHDFGPLGYRDKCNFVNVNEHAKLLENLDKNIRNNSKLPFIRHHLRNYDGQLPIWVAVEVFTLGMLYHLYLNLPTKNNKEIAREFNTGPKQFSSWIENITYLRNLIAHYMRLYNFRLQKTPAFCHKNYKVRINSYLVFDLIYLMMILIQDKDEWNNYLVPNINNLFTEYEDFIEIKCLGFPENWLELLVIQ